MTESGRRIYLGWAAEPFLCLREHADFRAVIQERLTAHFDTAGGYFYTDANCPDCRAKTAWTQAVTAFSPLQPLEAGRWTLVGSASDGESFSQPTALATAFPRNDSSYLTPNQTRGDWTRATSDLTNYWFVPAWNARVKAVLSEYGPADNNGPHATNMPVFWPTNGGTLDQGDNDANIYTYGGELIYTVNGVDPATLSETQIATDPTVKTKKTTGWKQEILVFIPPGQTVTIMARTRTACVIWSALNSAEFTSQ